MAPLLMALFLGVGAPGAAPAAASAPRLIQLEDALDRQQSALKNSRLTPERYRAFEVEFRAALAAAAAQVEPSSANSAVHARILSKLGEHTRASELLDGARRRDPDSAALLGAQGEVLFARGDYGGAARLARLAWLGSGQTDMRAFTLLKLSEGRGAGGGNDFSAANPPLERAAPRFPAAEAPGAALPTGFKTSAGAPPAPGSRPLDPAAPDYWDRQLLAPLLARSDANIVAREYLSPLLRDGKVTIRVVSDPSIAHAWGTYDLTTSVIKYNLDLINQDLREYNAFYARRDPGRVLAAISPRKPLDPKQIEFLTGRFLPLAVHEAGGHGSHAEALRKLLGTRAAPMNKDTELMAWRLEAAAIAAERRGDPAYLTEPTDWGKSESQWVRIWSRSRMANNPKMIEDYLDTFNVYKNLPNVYQDPKGVLPAVTAAVSLVQSRCKAQYDAACASAVSTLTALYPDDYKAELAPHIAALGRNPRNDRLRAGVMNVIFKNAVTIYRLDPKGIAVVTEYYNEQQSRVAELESAADPRGLWQSLKSSLQR